MRYRSRFSGFNLKPETNDRFKSGCSIIATTEGLEKMIKRRVKLKITIASRQTIRISGEILRTHCPDCDHEVEMLTEAQAAGILKVDPLTLDLLLADGQVHIIRTVSRSIRICKDSLFDKPLN